MIEGNAIEDKIADIYCTNEFIEKTKNKIEVDEQGWSSSFIPRLLSTVYHDFIKEEAYNFVKKEKNPIINFGRLKCAITRRIKEALPEVF